VPLRLDGPAVLGYHPTVFPDDAPGGSPLSALGPRIAALLLGLAGAPDGLAASEFPAGAAVTADSLDVFDGADGASAVSGRLARGDRVVVRDADRTGWLAIDPPAGAFCWVERDAVGPADRDSIARVVAAQAVVRSGHPHARMPGVPRSLLTRGTPVRLLDRPALTLGTGDALRAWYAIEPPPGDVRYVRADGVRLDAAPGHPPVAAATPISTASAEVRAGFAPDAVPAQDAPAVAAADEAFRAAVRGPIEDWRLDGARRRYEELLRGATDPATSAAIRSRLDEVDRRKAMADDARTIATLIERGRRRDAALALGRRRLADAQGAGARPYDFQGLVQPTSSKVDGRKVFALIGPDGRNQAFLDIPPGIDVKALTTRRVGVRGAVSYNESLRKLLIRVRDLEPLDAKH
jgi:hypothetical protein